jgi:hypothetical protein
VTDNPPERVVVQVFIENFNNTSGAAVVVKEFGFGTISHQVGLAADEATVQAVRDWITRREAPR